MTNVNFMSYPMACAYSNGVTKEQAELKNFMKDINTNIAINQAEVKCKFLEDVIENGNITQTQRNALVKELNAAKAELYKMYCENNVG